MFTGPLAADLLVFWPFASGWMLLWGLAAAIPILIHFLSRRRYDEVPWAAMDFLLAAMRKHARRWRIEQLLLLAVRTAILLLLAFALADPVMSLFGAARNLAGTAGNTYVVLVMDASYSMDYRQADATRFDLAKGLASEMVRSGRQGDGFSLVLMARPPPWLSAIPCLIARSWRAKSRNCGVPMAEPTCPRRWLRLNASSIEPHGGNRISSAVASFSSPTWDAPPGAKCPAARRRSILARLADKSELQVVDVGQSGGQNVAVTRVAVADGVVTVDRPTRIDVEVENVGSQDRTQHTVEVLVDGQRIAEEHLDIPAGGRSSAAVVHAFPIPGEHMVEVHSADDRLAVDNYRWLSLEVRPALEVLCVEGRSGAAKNVVYALEPGTSAQARVRPTIQSEIAPAGGRSESLRLHLPVQSGAVWPRRGASAVQVPGTGRRPRRVPGRSGAGRELQQHSGRRSG